MAKVYLYLTPGAANGPPLVKTVHRPQLYRSLPGRITPWDNRYFAFATDLQPGNQITTVILPEDAFYLTSANFYAKDLASMTQALTANVKRSQPRAIQREQRGHGCHAHPLLHGGSPSVCAVGTCSIAHAARSLDPFVHGNHRGQSCRCVRATLGLVASCCYTVPSGL